MLGDHLFEILLIYLNDIFVFSSDFKSHVESTVSLKLRECGLKLKQSKCHLIKQDMQFLGQIILAKGIRFYEGKTTVLRDRATYKCPRDVCQALGFMSYF